MNTHWLALLVLTCVYLLWNGLIPVAWLYGDPRHVLYPRNSTGMFCGIGQNKWDLPSVVLGSSGLGLCFSMLMSVCLSGINPASCILTSSNAPQRPTSWQRLCRASSVPPHRYKPDLSKITCVCYWFIKFPDVHEAFTSQTLIIWSFSILFLSFWFEHSV